MLSHASPLSGTFSKRSVFMGPATGNPARGLAASAAKFRLGRSPPPGNHGLRMAEGFRVRD